MLVRRTPKGQEELRARERTLGLRERGLLFLADGTRSLESLATALGPDTGVLLDALLRDGYLVLAVGEPAPPVARLAEVAAPAPAPHAADSFQAGRSLAGMRMYLFDVCERMFARGAPETAERYRQRLRQAREVEAMLAVAREMVQDVEELAGEQRARGLRERIEALMPDAGGA